MKVNQTTNICPRLKPVQLPLVGKWVSINSATRIFCRKAMMTGISSVRSWVMVICSLIPRAYLNSYFLAKIRTNCEQWATTKFDGVWKIGMDNRRAQHLVKIGDRAVAVLLVQA